METKIYIKFTGVEEKENATEIDLNLLGESLVGFDKIIKDFFQISGINCDVEVKATKVEKGSIIFHILLDLWAHNYSATLFTDPQVYTDFLRFIGVYQEEVRGTIKSLGELHTDLNGLFAKYPFDAMWIGIFITMMFDRFPKIKKNKFFNLKDTPSRYVEKIQKIKNKKTYKRALKPFIEDAVSKIEVDNDHEFKTSAEITRDNFSDFLTEDERILPDLVNGQKINVRGKVVGLIADHGDYVKLKIYDFEKKYSGVIALPGDDTRTDDFIPFYNKDVTLKLEVIRFSLYQKPKFIIHGIELTQQYLLS